MFMNEFNTINGGDDKANPANYKKKLEEILQYPGNEKILLAIGPARKFWFGPTKPSLHEILFGHSRCHRTAHMAY